MTRAVLLETVEREGESLSPEDVDRLAARQGVEAERVHQALRHLARADLLEAPDILGFNYGVVKDPILRDYLAGLVRVIRHGETWRQVQEVLTRKYRQLLGSYSDLIGLLAEAYVELLLRKFDDREVDGEAYFHVPG